MNSVKKASLFSCLMLYACLLLPAFEGMFYLKTFVFITGFAVSLLVLFLVKDETVSVTASSCIAIGIAIYDYEYLFVALPSVLLITAYSLLVNGKKKSSAEWANLLSTIAFMLIAAELVYDFISLQEEIGRNVSNIRSACMTIWLFELLLILLIWQTYSKKDIRDKTEKIKNRQLRKIYLLAFSGIAASAFNFYAVNGHGAHSYKFDFVYWLTFFVYIGIAGDCNLKKLTNKTVKLISKNEIK